MATLNVTAPTLVDIARQENPDGTMAQLVEMATRRNVYLQDMAWKQANGKTFHRVSSRYGLPSVAYRRYNEGVPDSKSRYRQFDETIGMMEGHSHVDRDLARLSGNVNAFRLNEDKGFFASMHNTFETNIAYASVATSPEKFHGIIPRLDATTSEAGGQIVLWEADDTGTDYTTILCIAWGADTVFGVYPEGMSVGIETIDMGEQMVLDASSNRLLVLETVFKWHHGIVVQDWRYISAVRNIDSGSIVSTNDDLVPAMIQALNKLESLEGVRPVFYMNRTLYTMLALQARNVTKNSTLSIENMDGKPVVMFQGYPVRRTDSITNTEDGIA